MIENTGVIQFESGNAGIEYPNHPCTVSLNTRTGMLNKVDIQNFRRNISS
jgi:hypothetical protein